MKTRSRVLVLATFAGLVLTQGHASAQTMKVSGGGKVGPPLVETKMVPLENPSQTVTMVQRVEPNHSNIPGCESMQVTTVAITEAVAGTGTVKGYRTSLCRDGDKTYATYDGTLKTVPRQGGPPEITVRGAWQYTGGTGRYEGIVGGGTYKGQLTSQGLVYDWEGEQTLKPR